MRTLDRMNLTQPRHRGWGSVRRLPGAPRRQAGSATSLLAHYAFAFVFPLLLVTILGLVLHRDWLPWVVVLSTVLIRFLTVHTLSWPDSAVPVESG